jgi:murein DD-endopeptidase MepM/ murein hydrolase activator NlpD
VYADSIITGSATPINPSSQITPAAPLKLTFPEPGPKPVSSWRPSLLPVPYALSPHDHFYLYRPIAVTSVNWPLPNYRYGYQDAETENPHTGVDIDAPMHTPILAAGDGKVVFTGYGLALGGGNTADPYGLAVVVRHNFSFSGRSLMTVYAHMEKITVKIGQTVKAGDQLGLVGITGNTTGPHVHFEVRLEKGDAYSVQNPELWMVPPTDYGVLVGRFKNNFGDYLTSQTVKLKSESSGKTWNMLTYAAQTIQNDPYFSENLVLGDLPIGNYKVSFLNNSHTYTTEISIAPGTITFISFSGGQGFTNVQPKPTDSDSFLIPFHN